MTIVNKTKSSKVRSSNFGFSTILLAFTMICIITFSVLALITANSDYLLSKKVATNNSTYYEVEEVIYSKIESIDKTLGGCYNSTNSIDDYFSRVQEELANYQGQLYYKDTDLFYQFNQKLSDTQKIEVTLQIEYPNVSTANFYEIKQWQTITDTSVETDNTLNLIK